MMENPIQDAALAEGERLRGLRNRLGLTQEAFAASLGVSKSLISSVERGVRRASRQLLDRLDAAYGLPADFFLTRRPGLPEDAPANRVSEPEMYRTRLLLIHSLQECTPQELEDCAGLLRTYLAARRAGSYQRQGPKSLP